MCRHFCFMAILLIIMPVNVFSQTTYDAESKLLSVKSEGSPLNELLSEVSAKTGIEVYISPAVDKKVFAEIESEPVEVAIKRMIKPLNNAFIYEGESIKAVKIFEKSESEATLQIAPGVTRSKLTSPSLGQGLDKRMLPREELEARARERRKEIAESQGRIEDAEKEKTKEERGSGRGKRRKIGKKKKEEKRELIREDEQQIQNQLDSEENPQNKVGD